MSDPAEAGPIGPGAEVGGFVIEAIVGRGGMGVVYRARQRRPERIVALKVIAPDLADDPDFRARFEREAMIAAQIEHPNVIPVYAAGDDGGILFIAMRFVTGIDLRALITREGRLEPLRAAAIIDQVAQALDAANAEGLIHRDVKPANILLSSTAERDHVYLTDFGLSRHVDATHGLTETGAFLGTIDYAAPEQARGDPVDARTDVYSLGCVLYHALAGTVPFPLENDVAKLYAHATQLPPSVGERAPDVPAAFGPVLRRAMAKAPDDRYPTAGDLGRAARAAAAADRPPAAVTAKSRDGSWGRLPRVAVLIGLPVAAVVAALLATPGARSRGSDIGATRTIHDQGAFVRATLGGVTENPRPLHLPPPDAGRRYVGVRMAVTNLGPPAGAIGTGIQLVTQAGTHLAGDPLAGDCKALRPSTETPTARGATVHVCMLFSVAGRDVPATVAFTPGFGRDTATWGLQQPIRGPQPRVYPGDCDAKAITRPPYRDGTCTTPEGVRYTSVYLPRVLRIGTLAVQVLGIRTADVLVNPASGVRARPHGKFVLFQVRVTNLLPRTGVLDDGDPLHKTTELFLPGRAQGILEAFPAVAADPRPTITGKALSPNAPIEGELIFDIPRATVPQLRQRGSTLAVYDLGENFTQLSSLGGIHLCQACRASAAAAPP